MPRTTCRPPDDNMLLVTLPTGATVEATRHPRRWFQAEAYSIALPTTGFVADTPDALCRLIDTFQWGTP